MPLTESYQKSSLERAIVNTQKLIDMGCGLVVVACNTATTNAIGYLRNHFDIPFVGIEPAIKPAAIQSVNKVVGVLATKGTLSSELFHKTSLDHASGVTLVEQSGDGLVEAIESPDDNRVLLKELLEMYLEPMLSKGMDSLVLGCTHYPLLIPIIKEILPAHIPIIDSGEAVAKQTHRLMESCDLFGEEEQPTHLFYGTGNIEVLKQFVPESCRVNCYLLS
jgi:glutamate racemase